MANLYNYGEKCRWNPQQRQLENINIAEAPQAAVKQEQSADIKETLSSTAAILLPV